MAAEYAPDLSDLRAIGPAAALFERALDRNPFPASPDFHRSLSDPLLNIPMQEACKDSGYRYSPVIGI